ncbi:MAG: hypothetical protein CBE26_03515 [Kiritimatiellaceae bacterium TMED266]|nr:MAG: hypothetical protein CBE26_03515 [Kiritimatiellaceae bacterium TMED266]
MKSNSYIAVIFMIFLMMGMDAFSQQLSGWNLVWSDEFDQVNGSLPDSNNWSYEVGGWGWGNGESQYYTANRAKNARIENGQLLIEMHKENYGGSQYTSARLLTENKFDFQYGRVESRLKVPDGGSGLWPAFWSLGDDFRTIGWPSCGEIDFMEYVSRNPYEIFGTIHGPGYEGGNSFGDIYTFNEPVANQYHVFAVEWDEDVIRWYVDDILYHTATPSDVAPNSWVFDHPFFLILNLAIGGNFGGWIDPNITFPQQYWIDYVRVYSRDEEEDLDPPTPNPLRIVSATGVSDSSVTLTAETAVDDNLVEYYFTSTSLGGHDSGWQSSPIYTDSGLFPETRYRYRVRARDLSLSRHETVDSVEAEAVTLPGSMEESFFRLIPNGDFESGDDNWVHAGGSVATSYESSGGNGDNGGYGRIEADENTPWAVLVNPREAGDVGGGIDIDSFNITPGEVHTFTIDLITFEGTGAGGIKVEAWAGNSLLDVLYDNRPAQTPSSWTTHSVDWLVPIGTEKLIFVPVWGVNSTVGFDNVGVGYNPPDPPELSEATLAEDGSFTFNWEGVANNTYTIQYKANLSESGWYTHNITNNVDGSVSVALELDMDQAFYRIISQ